MPSYIDGPSSPHFAPVPIPGNCALAELAARQISEEMRAALPDAPHGDCVCWGIPFHVDRVVAIDREPVEVDLWPTQAQWLVFMHTSDIRPLEWNEHGFISPLRGPGQLNERAADYIVRYADGSEERVQVRRDHQVAGFHPPSQVGQYCSQAWPHFHFQPIRPHHEQIRPGWGWSQSRNARAQRAWMNWLWAWENPHPEKQIVGLRCEPVSGVVILSALAHGEASSLPLRWNSRRKTLLTLPEDIAFEPELSPEGLLSQIQLDLGRVISATVRRVYPNASWEQTYNSQLPELASNEILVEYAAHDEACFHLRDGRVVPVSKVNVGQEDHPLQVVSPATQRVTLRAVEKGSGKQVPVKLHVHGEADEYLAPTDRHRIPNPSWFEDYSVDFAHAADHYCTYIPGRTEIKLPLGRVYVEVSKGFEIKPVRKVVEITPATEEVVIEVERVLPWRQRGWVTADTHVHFLSPGSALLEGSAEGVNVVNLLASQWGELMTNVGDFDGRTTWGSREAGGDGEYLVRVGTENRQHVMGHISLLGYRGDVIAPMTTGGPPESAVGDPVEVLLTEWASQCHKQGGLVVLPHFPQPRGEHVVALVEGEVDGVEMTSWGRLYEGINPYSLSDWYRYLNCGYAVPAVGGTDKMAAVTPVGAIRTYARIASDSAFEYGTWMEAVRRGETFVTYGPLMEFAVEGHPAGSHIALPASGGTVDVTWDLASVTVPMSRVDLIVNGEIRESVAVDPWRAAGSWSVKVERSSWLALLVRGHYADKPEIIAAHSSPVMVDVEGSPFFSAADAVTILEQIEGTMAYLDTVGTRAEDRVYKRMRLVLEGARRKIHNRLHAQGSFHEHTPIEDHAEHHQGRN